MGVGSSKALITFQRRKTKQGNRYQNENIKHQKSNSKLVQRRDPHRDVEPIHFKNKKMKFQCMLVYNVMVLVGKRDKSLGFEV